MKINLNFKNRIVLTIAISCTLCTIVAITVSRAKLRDEGRDDLINKSSAILSRIEVGSQYVADMNLLNGMVAESVSKFPDGKLSDEQKLKVLKTVPIYAAFKIGKNGTGRRALRISSCFGGSTSKRQSSHARGTRRS